MITVLLFLALYLACGLLTLLVLTRRDSWWTEDPGDQKATVFLWPIPVIGELYEHGPSWSPWSPVQALVDFNRNGR